MPATAADARVPLPITLTVDNGQKRYRAGQRCVRLGLWALTYILHSEMDIFFFSFCL